MTPPTIANRHASNHSTVFDLSSPAFAKAGSLHERKWLQSQRPAVGSPPSGASNQRCSHIINGRSLAFALIFVFTSLYGIIRSSDGTTIGAVHLLLSGQPLDYGHHNTSAALEQYFQQGNTMREKVGGKALASGDIDIDLMKRRLNIAGRDRGSIKYSLRHEKGIGWTAIHPVPNFFYHIPKTGGFYAFAMLFRMTFQAPEWNALSPKDSFRVCDVGAGKYKMLSRSYKGINCTMWVCERPYVTNLAKRSYTIIRNPREHILSQYFHCTESNLFRRPENIKRHKENQKRMPSLTEWLENWISALENETKAEQNSEMGCNYDPRNLQSSLVGFDSHKYSPMLPLAFVMEEIQEKFTVIGPMERMDKILCVIFLHYTGWIPGFCDCSESIDSNNILRPLHHQNHAHGTKHHGSSYNTTKYQDDLIMQLSIYDRGLHDYVTELFSHQVDVIEKNYNVTLCEKIKRDPWNFPGGANFTAYG